MCGIFGYSFQKGKVSDTRRAILGTNLARLNDDRGGHSWGLCRLVEGQIQIVRGLGEMAYSAYELADASMLFGHTRFATHGAKTVENAHPFEIGNIVGAHNGVLYNHYDLNKIYARDFDVDSMHLFAHLNDDLNFSEIEGYGSIEWVDVREPSRIYLCKMDGGDLAIAGYGDKKSPNGVLWSSSDKHLAEAIKCAGIKGAWPYQVEEGQVYIVENGVLYLSEKKLALDDNPRSMMKWHEYGAFSGAVTVGQGQSWKPWDSWEAAEKAEQEEADGNVKELSPITDFTDKAWNDYCLEMEAKEKEDEDRRRRILDGDDPDFGDAETGYSG